MSIHPAVRAVAAAAIVTAGLAGPAAAAPLVLYDPGTTTPPAGSLLQSTTAMAASHPAAPCGLDAPCTDLNTAASAGSVSPLGSGVTYGMSGEVSGTVSNHGQGGELGVLGWLKAGDTTLSLAVTVGAGRYDGRRFTAVPVGARP